MSIYLLKFRILFWLQEGPVSFLPSPEEGPVEEAIINAVQWLRLGVEAVGAIVIAIGIVSAVYYFARAFLSGQPSKYIEVRLILGRYLALALEFQLGADILSTTVAPSWEQIGKLGAIAVIRTALNFFLMREIEKEREDADRNAPLGSSQHREQEPHDA